MAVLIALSAAVLFFWLISLTKGLKAIRRGPSVRPGECSVPDSGSALVSVCVPARNEENDIGRCLESLCSQDYQNIEIIVADDGSTDGTARIVEGFSARDERVRLLEVKPPREAGWKGKPNALEQAVEIAAGEWILMTDADTVHKPWSVRCSLSYVIANGISALSLTPRLVCKGFWEKVVMPTVGSLIMARYPFDRVNDPDDPTVFGNGQFMLVRKDVFRSVGGWRSASGALDEDVVFAKTLKERGEGYHMASGEQIFETRMYESLGQIFKGFAKNSFSTMQRSFKRLFVVSIALLTLSFVPVGTFAISLACHLGQVGCAVNQVALWFGMIQFPLVLVIQALIRRFAGFDPWYCIFSPVSGFLVWLMVMYSAYLHVSGKGVEWKGRRYGT